MNTTNDTIREFNRFELKYKVTLQQAERFKRDLGRYMVPDQNGQSKGCYTLTSLYYDSPNLHCYRENEAGLKVRRKLRIRRYETGDPFTEESPVFLEIKQRFDRVTQKHRTVLSYQDALRLCNDRRLPDDGMADKEILDQVHTFVWRCNLRPASIVRYDRQAFMGTEYDRGLRVTFDTSLTAHAGQLHLHELSHGMPLLPANYVLMEIKVNERIPIWLTNLIAAHNLQRVGFSKYCRSIDVASNSAVQQRHRLRAESAHDVLTSAYSSFSTLEHRMGILREKTKQTAEVERGHLQHH